MEIISRKARLPIIKTKRLVLRDIQIRDISSEYVAWLNNPETNRHLEVRFTRQDYESVKSYVESKLRDTRNAKHFGIYDQEGQRLVGSVTLPHIDWNHSFADISFVIGYPGVQGHGYATEAVHGVAWYMFRECGLVKLWGGFYDGHSASEKVFLKNGFQIEGRMAKKYVNHENVRVDWVLMGILAEEFVEKEDLLGKLPPAKFSEGTAASC